jgi:hypothetical protein
MLAGGMRSLLRLALVLLSAATLAAAVLAAPAAAATTERVAGIETAATSSTGTFFGVLLDELGTWQTTIQHADLNKAPGGTTAITGGSFSLSPFFAPAESGMIGGGQLVAQQPSGDVFCTQQFVGTGTFTGGGSFQATLTHYGVMAQGVCNAFFASVTGSVTLP